MKQIFLAFFILTNGIQLFSQTIYVATNGLTSNNDLTIDTTTTLANIFSKLGNGQESTLYFRGREYLISKH